MTAYEKSDFPGAPKLLLTDYAKHFLKAFAILEALRFQTVHMWFEPPRAVTDGEA